MKHEYRYVERETEKALLLTDGSRAFWIPKSIADIHPRYSFLAKPFSFFEIPETERYKRWKRKSLECMIPIFMVKASCRWCGSGHEEWVSHDHEIKQTDEFYCPKCRSGIRNDEASIVLEFVDELPFEVCIRALDFMDSRNFYDYEAFTNPYITVKGQLAILNQDMREYGGYYENGITRLEDLAIG